MAGVRSTSIPSTHCSSHRIVVIICWIALARSIRSAAGLTDAAAPVAPTTCEPCVAAVSSAASSVTAAGTALAALGRGRDRVNMPPVAVGVVLLVSIFVIVFGRAIVVVASVITDKPLPRGLFYFVRSVRPNFTTSRLPLPALARLAAKCPGESTVHAVAGLQIQATSTLVQHALMDTFRWATCSVVTIHSRKHYYWQKATDICQ
ncbi:unnamed protein product [Phytophthora fragariaefolia]|uniref:Unnamed protein product n=1 Tax=Phytophthora fragariaefolia TaxID=1490495 RepID=A0A9W6Y2M2_9STRA|nr:unnamed protein product [Phytophthora fragariaefolia]